MYDSPVIRTIQEEARGEGGEASRLKKATCRGWREGLEAQNGTEGAAVFEPASAMTSSAVISIETASPTLAVFYGKRTRSAWFTAKHDHRAGHRAELGSDVP